MTTALALASLLIGLAWLALAKDTHWQQVTSTRLTRRRRSLLRGLGATALAAAFALALAGDHPSIAVLVWFMGAAAGSLAVAAVLAFRPGWLAPLAGPRSA
jgi:hypothetical protein